MVTRGWTPRTKGNDRPMNTATATARMTHKDLTVAPETKGAAIAGRTAWWDLRGPVGLDRVHDVLTAAGVPEDKLPGAPTVAPRLFRACEAVADRDQMVRPVKSGTFRGGYALMTEGQDANGFPKGGTALAVRASRDDQGVLTLEFSDAAHPKAKALAAEFTRAGEMLTGTDISAWLATTLVPLCLAVRLRQSGGFYFIPAPRCALWLAAVEAIASVTGCEFYDLPVHTQATAIRAAVKAIQNEAEEGFAKVAKSLQDGTGRRGLRSREREMEALAAKLAEYEAVLGVTLDSVKAKAKLAKNNVAQALLEDDED